MRIVTQNLRSGETKLVDIACPQPLKGEVLIKTSNTLLSAGTEKMLMEFGKSNLISKAFKQPEKLQIILNKLKTDGLTPTFEAVMNKLDAPLPLGYCNVGEIIAKGSGVTGYKIGDRVVSNGFHAEAVCVPVNLIAKIPDSVSYNQAVFTVLGSIALQGIRLAKPSLGECFVVTGLGLIGLLTVQLLRANGCRVLGIDFDKTRLSMAQELGAETFDLNSKQSLINFANQFSRSRGVDGVLITAATSSNKPIKQAAEMCRKLGRIVLIGTTGLELSRDDFFKKEITFQVSASYGPGRYDPSYEEKGNDYPIGYVRWTEQRNFEAFLDMIKTKKINLDNLISHRYKLDEFQEAYNVVTSSNPSLGVILEYPKKKRKYSTITHSNNYQTNQTDRNTDYPLRVGLIGAGSFARGILIPAIKKNSVQLQTIVSRGGLNGWASSKKYGFISSSTNPSDVLKDTKIDTVFIATRHNTHAELVIDAIAKNKNVFVEKPLCLTLNELEEIQNTYFRKKVKPKLMVGFNRRFSPLVQELKNKFAINSSPKSMVITVNAGEIPSDSWIHDKEVGGGRIIGECCHFIDLLRFIADSKIVDYSIVKMNTPLDDTFTINLTFEDGSIGSINYFANGNRAVAKEKLEVYCGGEIAQLENFKKLSFFTTNGKFVKRSLIQNKGHRECVKHFLRASANKQKISINFEEIFEVHRVSIELQNS